MTASGVPLPGQKRELPLSSRRLLRGMLALALLVVAAIVVVTLRGAYQSVEQLSDKLIGHAMQRTRAELTGYFKPVKQLLRAAEGWANSSLLDLGDAEHMNRLFVPVVRESPVSSLLVARTDGTEYMLLERDNGWQNRLTSPSEHGASRLIRYNARLEKEREWTDRLGYDPRKRPWFQGAIQNRTSDIYFTAPYTFFTTKDPGITASLKVRPKAAAADYVIAFDVKLLDITKFTSELSVTPRAELVVMTEDRRVIGLPAHERFRGLQKIKASLLKTPEELGLGATVTRLMTWGKAPREVPPSPFKSGGEDFWGGIQSFELAPGNKLWILVAIPEADLTGRATSQRNLIVAILAVLLLSIILTMVLVERALRRDVLDAVHQARRLGQYTLEEKLGAGGMGEVYRASHAMLRRPTAVKLLKKEKARSAIALSRFEREVQITAELTHPNTIAIYDFGHTPDGEFYYAMEYVDGVTLEDLVERTGPMPPERIVFVLRQVCGSLQEAHERGLIHRDIKPANIMLCERGGQYDAVKVLDFGLVKSEQPMDSVQLTRANALTGTPLYLPPEAATDPGAVDARSDIYSLGAVAYFLGSGRPVFEGNGLIEILTQHMTQEPEPLSEIVPGFPSDVWKIIAACLSKNPSERPPSASELSQRLAESTVAEQWTQRRARAWWGEHKVRVSTPAAGGADAHTKTMTVAINPERSTQLG